MTKRGIQFDTADPKHRQRIIKISEVAAELFGTKGYLETSIDDIAAAARVTKGGVYYYFKSKAEILYFICSTYVDTDMESLEQSLKRFDASIEKIKFIVFRHIEHYSMYEYSAKTLLNESYCLPTRYFKRVKSREREYLQIVKSVLSEYLGPGVKKSVITALAFSLFGLLNWIYSWYDPKKSLKPKELSNIIFQLFVNGIKAGPRS
ncbi:MAG: TetR/AcrR family transcriptional regulator [Deltaproteobacteria bacterium]|nr:TetR/AcrR family transcriptional regulator [Deltaproteobacteria bacterium]